MSEEEVHRLTAVAGKTSAIVVFALLAVLVGAILQKVAIQNRLATLLSTSERGFVEEKGSLNLRYTSGEVTNVNIAEGKLTISPQGSVERTVSIDEDTMFVRWMDSTDNTVNESDTQTERSQTESQRTSSRTESQETSTRISLPEAPYETETLTVEDIQPGMNVGLYTDTNLLGADSPRAALVATVASPQQSTSEQTDATENGGNTSEEGATTGETLEPQNDTSSPSNGTTQEGQQNGTTGTNENTLQ